MYEIHHADILEWAKNYKGEPFDGILCDPPYEIGFMSRSWDSTGIAFNQEMWKAVYDIMKPGAYLLAFSGSRTYHRMVVAIEDAGFEIRDMIEWVYGSGFPKSLNIGKVVDKMQGNERESLGIDKTLARKDGRLGNSLSRQQGQTGEITKGTSPYEGYGTALKPAHEPIVLARKPLEKGLTVAQNALKHGTGGINIDGSRVGTEQRTYKGAGGTESTMQKGAWGSGEGKSNEYQATGRFPANLIHDGSDEVVDLFPDTKGSKTSPRSNNAKSWKNTSTAGIDHIGHNDSGSAARFFYCAKASKSERNAGLEGFEGKFSPTMNNGIGGKEHDPETATRKQNHHPTVKPLSLTKYLATLIKPPTGGRLLVPFSGSGSEMIGALQAGWEYVEGVELTEEYIPIAEARIKHWTSKPVQDTLL